MKTKTPAKTKIIVADKAKAVALIISVYYGITEATYIVRRFHNFDDVYRYYLDLVEAVCTGFDDGTAECAYVKRVIDGTRSNRG